MYFKFEEYDTRNYNYIIIEDIKLSNLVQKDNSISINTMDGNFDFSYSNYLNRKFYENRNIIINILVRTSNETDYQTKINEIFTNLYSINNGDITISNCNGVKFNGSLYKVSEIQRIGNVYRVIVQFMVKPFGFSDLETINLYNITSGNHIEVIDNIGSWYTDDFKITITGNFENLKIKNNGNEIEYTGGLYLNQTLVIDFKNYTITRIISDSIQIQATNSQWKGNFFELNPKINNLNVYTNGNISSFVIEYIPKFLYSKDGD